TVEQIKERFGDKLVEGDYIFAIPNTLTGYSAGSVFPKNIQSVTYPDLPSTTSFTQSIQYEDFDLKTGSPKTYIVKNKNLKDEKTVKSTLETSVNSENVLMNYENRHMISYPTKVTISSDGILLRELQYDYGLLSNGNIELIKETTSSSSGKKTSSINGYDELGKLIKKISNNGLITNFRYDNEGRIIKQWTSEHGNEINPLTEYSYDIYGRLKERKRNDGTKIEYEYDGLGRRTKEINNLDTKDKPTIQYIYFNPVQGKPIKTIIKTKLDENNYQELVEFKDGKDNIIQTQTKIKDKQYLVTAKKIDSQGRIIYVSKPFLENTNDEYTTSLGESNIEYVYENALFGRLIKKVYPDNSFTEFSYKAENNLPVIIATDQNKNIKKMTYDTQGNIIKLEEGPTLSLLSVTTTYEYDEQSRLVKIIDALGRTFIQNEYNNYGLTKSTSIDAGYIIMNYDEMTGYLSNTKTQNNVVSYDYD
ncbi:MAG: RHS repeat domain-containing protein, partial [Nanoarchaeota archaeon]